MISVIIPTYNESENILNVCGMVSEVLTELGEPFEVLVMDDDSPDRTSDIVNQSVIPHVRSINRKGKARGLSAAVIDGFEAAKGDKIAVMDADLSHPPELLKKMADALNHAGIELAVGSRYVRGGGSEGWPAHRVMA
ncbi:MAG: glycosyltransferase, partial [Candidatus Omnitrophica bacterium]|nr:glycosyltransferase [Candidatus Omnitrophota bacterium]